MDLTLIYQYLYFKATYLEGEMIQIESNIRGRQLDEYHLYRLIELKAITVFFDEVSSEIRDFLKQIERRDRGEY